MLNSSTAMSCTKAQCDFYHFAPGGPTFVVLPQIYPLLGYPQTMFQTWSWTKEWQSLPCTLPAKSAPARHPHRDTPPPTRAASADGRTHEGRGECEQESPATPLYSIYHIIKPKPHMHMCMHMHMLHVHVHVHVCMLRTVREGRAGLVGCRVQAQACVRQEGAYAATTLPLRTLAQGASRACRP